MGNLWECEADCADLVDVPDWIDEISPYGVAAINQGGCASGAYMPAVTYHKALATMNEHGDAIFEYLTDTYGELPEPGDDVSQSWAGLACFFVSAAVESWASSIEQELSDAIDAADEANE